MEIRIRNITDNRHKALSSPFSLFTFIYSVRVTFCYGRVSFCPYNANSNLTRRYKVTLHLKHIHVTYLHNCHKYTHTHIVFV
jgi:hypothetical protein